MSIVFVSPISGITDYMIDPITEQMLREIMIKSALTDVIKDNIYINADYMASSITRTRESNPIVRNNRIECTINYVLDPSKTKWDMLTQRVETDYGNMFQQVSNLDCIFRNDKLGMVVKEHTIPCSVQADCVINILDKTTANDVYNNLYLYYGAGKLSNITNIMFSYPLPEMTQYILGYGYMIEKEFYIDDSVSPAGPSFNKYLRQHSENKMGPLFNQNMAKPKAIYVVNKNIMEVTSEITINDDKPQPVKTNKSVNHYTISFTVNFQFDRPDVVYNIFPIIIKNQLTPMELMPEYISSREIIYDHMVHPYIDILTGMSNFDSSSFVLNSPSKLVNLNDNTVLAKQFEIFRQPFYDNFDVPVTHLNDMGFSPFYIGAIPIDETNTVTSQDLSLNLGDDNYPVHIKPEVLAILFDKGLNVFNGSLSIAIAVFVNDKLIEPTTLTYVGNTITIPNRDIYKIYRIVMYENKEVTKNVQTLRVLKCDIVAIN